MLQTTTKGEWFILTVPDDWNGKTVEDIFREVWQAPKKMAHSFRMNREVLLNGEPANWRTPLESGMKFQVHFFQNVEPEVTPYFLDVPILFEDEHLLVLNKPSFLNTHPNSAGDNETLLNAAAFYLQSKGEQRKIRHVHRLDKETSGAILFAKHELAGAILDRMLEKREIKRTYLALVHSILRKKSGTIHEPIGRDRHHPTRRRVSPSGQNAVTHFQVIKELKDKQLSLVKCWLDTGRTHQIRVHLSYLGHPIAGDSLYGGSPIIHRVGLHAAKLEFIHPFTQENIICFAPLPDLLSDFVSIDITSI